MTEPLDGAARALRLALRALRREPVFAAAVVLTLALPVGTNAATFGLVRQLMLAPPPGVRDPGRVARVQLRYTEDGESWAATTTSYPAFAALRGVRALVGVAATRSDTLTVGRGPDLARVAALAASGDYFATLGARPALGRFFDADEDAPPSGAPVVVLGHAYWRRSFGADRAAVGRAIVLDGRPFTVIGVAPAGFDGDQAGAVDVYVPLSAALAGDAGWVHDADRNLVSVVVRRRDGVALDAASRAATVALRESPARRARDVAVELAPVVPGREARETPQARVALWLAGVSLVILLVATANAGTLFSLRWARRRRELAVRLALGARRSHLAGQLLAEGLLLAALGAAAGLLLSRWLADVLRATLLSNLAAAAAFVDQRVLAASVLAALAAGAAAGLAPLARTGRANLAAQLQSAGGYGASARPALQAALVGAQVALVTLLLVGAALFVRSLQRVRAQDLGFTTERLAYVTLEFRGYVSGAERDLAYRDAERRLRTLPEVAAVTVVQGVPFGPHHIPPLAVPGMSDPPNVGGQIPIMYAATPEYLDIMGVTPVRGRVLTEADGAAAPLVILVNETMARRVWPGRSALGQCVRVGFGAFPTDGNPAASAPCRTVVGVVRDSRARSLRPEGGEDALMQYYVPFGQVPPAPRPDQPGIMGLMVQARGDVDRAAARAQRTIHATSLLPVYANARRYQDLIDPQLRPWRLGATLFTAFGALALGIAAAGVFGVVSYAAAQRTREMGIRLALGATRRGVARLVVADALRVSAVGAAIGLAGALLAGPLVEPMLFGTSPRDPGCLAVAVLALLVATLAAAAWPAWRAGRVPPVAALRADG